MLNYLVTLVILISAAYLVVRAGRLSHMGGLAGIVTGFMVFLGAQYTGLVLLAAFFLMGTAATSWKKSIKQRIDPVETETGGRTAGQVLANGGVAALSAITILLLPGYHDPLLLMMAGSLSAAAADTLSSEIGMVKGRRFYNILTFKKDRPGLNGVVSLEGTVAGIAGSCVIATCYLLLTQAPATNYLVLVFAGTAGNVADSLLGATLERKRVLNNDAVNAMNTAIGAVAVLPFV